MDAKDWFVIILVILVGVSIFNPWIWKFVLERNTCFYEKLVITPRVLNLFPGVFTTECENGYIGTNCVGNLELTPVSLFMVAHCPDNGVTKITWIWNVIKLNKNDMITEVYSPDFEEAINLFCK